MKKHIPNFITLLNLLCGCISIVFAFRWSLEYAAYFIFLAAIFDFIDGFSARMLHVKSEIGKQLDSLADIVSFGLAPGVILYVMLNHSMDGFNTSFILIVVPFVAFSLPLFSAIRLAKFNIDSHQEDSFIGLPTPASALLVASVPLISIQTKTLAGFEPAAVNIFFTNFYFLITLILLLSWLMVSKVELLSLKFHSYHWKPNKSRYLLLSFSILFLLLFQYMAIPFIFILYLGFSIFSKD